VAAERGWFATVQPIVLVGGRSRRFGRDKLREPSGDGMLVDRPIAALREVFGPRVLLVGDCHPEVAMRGDAHRSDDRPGAGPAEGILRGLEGGCDAVLVLAGDLPAVTGAVVRDLLAAAEAARECPVVLARTDRPEPTVGLYRSHVLEELRSYAAAPDRPLHALLSPTRVAWVAVDAALLRNVNEERDLRV
jgi:molybdopterin-guanine dinucleotide biosynthesis protein A